MLKEFGIAIQTGNIKALKAVIATVSSVNTKVNSQSLVDYTTSFGMVESANSASLAIAAEYAKSPKKK